MKWRTGVGLVVVLMVAGCGTRAAKLQNDQTVQLKGDTPVALVLDPQPKDYDMTLEITADQPIDVSLFLNKTVDEAVAEAKKHGASNLGYSKSNAKDHKIESTIAANVRMVLVMYQTQGSGRATVQVKRTK
jgi:hypothetical protein